MKLSIVEFAEGKQCDNCGKTADAFHVRCDAGTLDAELCAKCLARQCKLRAKAQAQQAVATRRSAEGGAV